MAGVPLVVPDIGVYPELMEMTGGGVMFRQGDNDDLDQKLQQMLTEAENAREIGLHGREIALKELSATAAAQRILALIEE